MRHLEQTAPLRALFPQVGPEEPPQAALVNTGGGVVAGDRYEIDVAVEAGAALTATTPAAEKIYRSEGETAEIFGRLRCAAGGTLEWLPQETILFDAASLERRLEVDLAGDARFLGVEMMVLGRRGHGEILSRGALRDAWIVRVAGKPVWADAIGFSGELSPSRFALDGNVNFATIVVVAPDAANLGDDARQLAGENGGATCVNGVLLLRFLDRDFARLRAAVEKALAVLRPRVTGGPAAVPRLWLN